MTQYKNVLITWNNYDEYVPDEVHNRDCYFKNEFKILDAHYMLVAYEEAPTTGHPHLHMMILLNHHVGRTWLTGRFRGCNVEIIQRSRDNFRRVYEYVRKNNVVWFEEGKTDFLIQKKLTAREEHDILMQKINSGTLTDNDKDSYQYAKLQRFYDQKIIEKAKKPAPVDIPDLKYKNLWIHGPTGTGKSRLVHQYAAMKGLAIYNKLQNKWWDGFNDHPIVHVEEASPEKMRVLGDHMKQWADRYPFLAEIKGSSKQIEPKFNFIVTSNYTIKDCFKEEDVPPLERRFDTLEMKRAPTPVEPEPTTEDFWEEWPQAQELPKTP